MRVAWLVVCAGCRINFDPSGDPDANNTSGRTITQQAYLKASNTDAMDQFGYAIALSGDGNTLAVGADQEQSGSINIGGNQNDNSAAGAGAVYVFVRSGSQWTQQAYIKPPDTTSFMLFGQALVISDDGNTLVASAPGRNLGVGAAYVYTRSGAVWTFRQTLIPGFAESADGVAAAALSGDGSTLVLVAGGEDSDALGIYGDETNNLRLASGAAWVFALNGSTWNQQAYIKASNPDAGDSFGDDASLSRDGSTLVVGAGYEASASMDPSNNAAPNAGAAYVFARAGTTWSQEAYLKAVNADASDFFGRHVHLSADGLTLAVRALGESSSARGVGGDPFNNTAVNSGASYIFTRSGTTWTQSAYLKSSNSDPGDDFGAAGHVSADGSLLVAGAPSESSSGRGLTADPVLNDAASAGAVYVFDRTGGWHQTAYVKASNPDANDQFGRRIAISADGTTWAIGAPLEAGGGRGASADPADNSAPLAGAVYVFTYE